MRKGVLPTANKYKLITVHTIRLVTLQNSLMGTLVSGGLSPLLCGLDIFVLNLVGNISYTFFSVGKCQKL
ncbi:hypothetical protein GDO81_009311 [Engystomops pustulosus]|uniref:Uncharacterized protein n=1 Tax=Engystomops pustulosus TaxID=76066 RepID=A0AAV7BQ82_ENGPU|nr:hypothetical protein GDO81_009311 [Engystomops pustulosus]